MWVSNMSLLDLINKGKRKQLVKFLRKMGAERESYLYYDHAPQNSRQDDGGTIFCFVSVKSRQIGQDRTLYTVIDTVKEDGQEDFQTFKTVHEEVAELLMPPVTEEKTLPTYDPEIYCLYPKSAFGRPRAELSEEEKEQIKRMREQKIGYNKIARILHRNNRVIINYCKANSLL